jgi:hypothetical protein
MARELLCCDIDGLSLHAAVRVDAHERKRLEQLCRYITRPALADERVQLNDAGQVELKLKTAWRDGTTHVVMSPLDSMQLLAALVWHSGTAMTAFRQAISVIGCLVRVGCWPIRTAGNRRPKWCNWTAALRALVNDSLRCSAEIGRAPLLTFNPSGWFRGSCPAGPD